MNNKQIMETNKDIRARLEVIELLKVTRDIYSVRTKTYPVALIPPAKDDKTYRQYCIIDSLISQLYEEVSELGVNGAIE